MADAVELLPLAGTRASEHEEVILEVGSHVHEVVGYSCDGVDEEGAHQP